MQAKAVVRYIDVSENGCSGLLPSLESSFIDYLLFEVREEAFDISVIETSALGCEAGSDIPTFEVTLESVTGVLTTPYHYDELSQA